MTATVRIFRPVVEADLTEVVVLVDVPVVGQLAEGQGIVLELNTIGAPIRLLAQVRGVTRPTMNLDPSGTLRLRLEEVVIERAQSR